MDKFNHWSEYKEISQAGADFAVSFIQIFLIFQIIILGPGKPSPD